MERQPKPLVRVTQIEAFRRWTEQSDYDNFEITEQSVIDSITGAFAGNDLTRIGTAFHSIVETGAPQCRRVEAGLRNNDPTGGDPVPCGREFTIDGHAVTLDVEQCRAALAYRAEHPEAYHECRVYCDFGEATVTGCADMIDGTELRDIKTKFSAPRDSAYTDSCQWRFYLQMFGADTLHFDLFVFGGYNAAKHGADVRGLPLTRREPITCHRYAAMEQDNARLLARFMEWARYRNLTECLINQKV